MKPVSSPNPNGAWLVHAHLGTAKLQAFHGPIIMSYAAHHKDFGHRIAAQREHDKTNASVNAGLWQRLFKAVSNSRRRRAEREIARFIQGRGGHLTDELERDLMRHLTSSPSYWGMHF